MLGRRRDARCSHYGSTVATNALLERRGARVVLLTTRGFEDVLEIGRQTRPDLYALEPRRPEPLVPRSAPDRRARSACCADGRVEVALGDRAVRRAVAAVRRAAARRRSRSVCCTATQQPVHERRLGARAARPRDCTSRASHRLVREYREYERLATTRGERLRRAR